MSAILTAEALAYAGRLAPTALALRGGELTCLIGPNGSGKTSLLHALGGIGGASGRVLIDGIDPTTLGPDDRKRLFAYLPATRDVAWPISAADLIGLGLPKDAAPEPIAPILAALDLTGMTERRIDQLSTGERSRVLIARALAARPKVLLLDEPVANLDPLWQLRLMDYLQALTRETGCAALVAIHDLELARTYADRLIIMAGGWIAADGAPQALLDGPYIPDVFGIERKGAGWRPLVRPAGPRSSR